MHKILRLLAVPVAFAPTLAHADQLQAQVAAAARATPADTIAFTRTIASEQAGGARKVIVHRYDPRRAADARWTLASIDGKPPTDQQREGSAKRTRDSKAPGYAHDMSWLAAPATRSDGPTGYVTYHYAQLPAGTVKFNAHDASADTHADVVVNTHAGTPFVERVRMWSDKPFRMMMVAQVAKLAFVSRYRRLDDTLVVPVDTMSDITGTLMGKSGNIRSAITYGDVQRVR